VQTPTPAQSTTALAILLSPAQGEFREPMGDIIPGLLSKLSISTVSGTTALTEYQSANDAFVC
jgi:hypothetical protein